MPTITIDSYQLVKGLIAAGFKEEQAEAILDTIQHINLEGVASREDITGLKQDIVGLKESIGELKQEIIRMEARFNEKLLQLMKWQFASALGIVGAVAALVKLL